VWLCFFNEILASCWDHVRTEKQLALQWTSRLNLINALKVFYSKTCDVLLRSNVVVNLVAKLLRCVLIPQTHPCIVFPWLTVQPYISLTPPSPIHCCCPMFWTWWGWLNNNERRRGGVWKMASMHMVWNIAMHRTVPQLFCM